MTIMRVAKLAANIFERTMAKNVDVYAEPQLRRVLQLVIKDHRGQTISTAIRTRVSEAKAYTPGGGRGKLVRIHRFWEVRWQSSPLNRPDEPRRIEIFNHIESALACREALRIKYAQWLMTKE